MLIDNIVNKDLVIPDMLNELISRDYKFKFGKEAICFYCIELRTWIWLENFTVDNSYYLEVTETPDADGMLYAVFILQLVKSFLLDTCNVYMDYISPGMMEELKANKL